MPLTTLVNLLTLLSDAKLLAGFTLISQRYGCAPATFEAEMAASLQQRIDAIVSELGK